jgi:hypothetical protein
MRTPTRSRWQTLVALGGVGALLLAVSPAGAGMAELGRKRNLTASLGIEGAGDTAAGGYNVTLLVENEAFVHTTSAGETVGAILAALAAQINGEVPQKYDASVSGAVITVVRHQNGNEVSRFGMVNEDVNFGLVEATHQNGAMFLLAVCQPPAGGTVQVTVNGTVAATVNTTGLTADQVNASLASQLGGQVTGDCGAPVLSPQRRRIIIGTNATRLAWEDNDTGITVIGVRNDIGAIPTLSDLGVLLLSLSLAAVALVFLRRRPARRRAR